MANEPRHQFHATDATRESIILRASICGPTGCGKTQTGLIIATRMVERMGLGPVYVIDSENRSALRYAYSPRTKRGYRFKHVEMPTDDYSPQAYMRAIDYCEAQGAGVILIDSFSHAWMGINGALEQVDAAPGRSKFSDGWKTVTPIYARLIQRLQETGAHMIWTLRAKMAYDIIENDRGKKEPVKLGLAPIAREGIEYEGDLAFNMTVPHNDLVVGKSRCDLLVPGEVIKKPGNDLADLLIEWLQDAEPQVAARSLGEAISIAVMEGITAAEAKAPEQYTRARQKLVQWCKQNGVSESRLDVAQAQLKERVAAATQMTRGAAGSGKHPDAPPPSDPSNTPAMTDEERIRRVDLGLE